MSPTWRPSLPSEPPVDEALSRLTSWLRTQAGTHRARIVSLRQFLSEEIIAAHAAEQARLKAETGYYPATETAVETNTGSYFEAAWSLCTIGVLSPAPRWDRGNGTFTVSDEFRITDRGIEWLSSQKHDPVLPAELARFSGALANHDNRFGSVYRDRGQEALKCYHSQCYYACCVMVGAAAEAILVGLASVKSGDPDAVDRDIRAVKGREKLLNRLKTQRNGFEQKALDQFVDLVAFYRDDAAHGLVSQIGEEDAHLALITLLRCARFADERWDALVT